MGFINDNSKLAEKIKLNYFKVIRKENTPEKMLGMLMRIHAKIDDDNLRQEIGELIIEATEGSK